MAIKRTPRRARIGKSSAVLFRELEEVDDKRTAYDPLPSVWYGDDAALLEQMLRFYPKKPPKDILDATINAGRFWIGSRRKIVGMDIDPKHSPDILADNRNMPCKDASFDIVVYDPPHVPNQGKDKSKDFNRRFGLILKSSVENGYNFTPGATAGSSSSAIEAAVITVVHHCP